MHGGEVKVERVKEGGEGVRPDTYTPKKKVSILVVYGRREWQRESTPSPGSVLTLFTRWILPVTRRLPSI